MATKIGGGLVQKWEKGAVSPPWPGLKTAIDAIMF